MVTMTMHGDDCEGDAHGDGSDGGDGESVLLSRTFPLCGRSQVGTFWLFDHFHNFNNHLSQLLGDSLLYLFVVPLSYQGTLIMTFLMAMILPLPKTMNKTKGNRTDNTLATNISIPIDHPPPRS